MLQKGVCEAHKCPRFNDAACAVWGVQEFCSRMVEAARMPDGVSPKRRRNVRLK